MDSNGGIWEGVRIKKNQDFRIKKKENYILLKKIKVLLIGGGVEVSGFGVILDIRVIYNS